MRTRSTSSIEVLRRAAIAVSATVLLVFVGCERELLPVEEPTCRVNQFRRCDHECGRGVEQCIEPGVWTACACTVLDAGSRPDARPVRDAADAGDANDAREGDVAHEPPVDAGEDGEVDAVGEAGNSDGQPD
jgi:hypothetical protein